MSKKNFKKFWKLGRRDFSTEHFDINPDGELVIREGNYQYNVLDLVRKFGSPTEVFLPFVLEERLERLFDVAEQEMKRHHYRGKFFYHYPMKVNQNREFVLPLVSEGAHLEVGSPNELWLVKKLWEGENFHAKIRVLCNGPKTPRYINLITGLQSQGLAIVPIIEDAEELRLLKDFRGELGVRINLQSKVQSHWDKKIDRFGLLEEEILSLGKIRNLKILHYHIGSQVERENDLLAVLKEALRAYVKVRAQNPSLDTLDVGGGFAVPYEKKPMYTVESVLRRMFSALANASAAAGIPHPNLIVEWGRHLAAPAQISVFKVVATKVIPKGIAKFWYVIDGSFMTDLLDTWSIHQKWHIVPVGHAGAEKRHRVWLGGLTCDSDDKYADAEGYVLLPRIEDLGPGEDLYLAIFDTGAYQDSFAMHHCLISSPAKIVLQNGLVTMARKRESPEEIGKMFGW
ncbi:MAG: hypothetical protein HYV42_05165 [Candidatus Magasanikbacteria bacterium]|nr:hypothetical protein [Candidatus Magasanikbacteria bacterium]